jgi:2-polyprenyl-6-methoxyphenol hydroxylase-like FAD-dependent oxidoreductase
MAVEDGVVLAEELSRAEAPESAFVAYRARRIERCRHVVETSVAIGRGQLGIGSHARDDETTVAASLKPIVKTPHIACGKCARFEQAITRLCHFRMVLAPTSRV